MDKFLSGASRPPPKKQTPSKSAKNVPWVEKYRPKTVDEVAHQPEVVAVLKKCLDGADLPNLLFYGPPGTGKTSLILALARQLFGSLFSDRVLELNASDERGIAVIREKVKNFARLAVGSGGTSTSRGPPPYKLVILDEADSMTAPAQAALRRTMETEMKTTRFCLTCNYVSRIIGPITSRCAKFRFRPLDNNVAKSRLRQIAEAESLSVSDATLDHLMRLCEGDLRQGITLLQSASLIVAPLDAKGEKAEVTDKHLDELTSVVPTNFEISFLSATRGRNFEKLRSTVKDLLYEGFSALQLITQLQTTVLEAEDFTEPEKKRILEALAEADARLVDGADEYLQLLAVGGSMIKAIG
uniref:Replication factor C subunit 4 n=2 Tax=Schistocephalus solidus TaxID=70667 RepID=A0A0X3PWP9_SCHSO